MNKVNPFPALRAPRALIFLLNLSNIDEVANLGNTTLTKETASFIGGSLPNFTILLRRNPLH